MYCWKLDINKPESAGVWGRFCSSASSSSSSATSSSSSSSSSRSSAGGGVGHFFYNQQKPPTAEYSSTLASNTKVSINSLWARYNRRAMDHYTAIRWLIHWPLMGGLYYIWYSKEGPGWDVALPSPLLAVPYVTVHPSTASVPVSYYSTWHYNCLCTPKGKHSCSALHFQACIVGHFTCWLSHLPRPNTKTKA